MRRARLTYKGAFHHVMNRGHDRKNIFRDDTSKSRFLEMLEARSTTQRIRVFAYCIMDNHYHIILQNASGKLSEFVKQLNGDYGSYYRKRVGGVGYVFQGRFKSTLIQEDKYLDMAIIYALLNPVRARMTTSPWGYRWSSIREYFARGSRSFLDTGFVEDLFGDKRVFQSQLKEWSERDLPVKKTRMGDVLGEDSFIEKAVRQFDRRKVGSRSKRMRKQEYDLPSVEKTIREFEKKRETRLEEIDVKTRVGRALRNELLVTLKDEAGLPYSEIVKHPLFRGLKYSSLPQFYKRAKSAAGHL
jgi:REP element-mobilizing transposase RayT